LFWDFREAFGKWTTDVFRLAARRIRTELKKYLMLHGIFVRTPDIKSHTSDKLAELLSGDPRPWPPEELEIMKSKGDEFKSRKHKPQLVP
jgi:hypothetical protein